jgi:hypothetical protein
MDWDNFCVTKSVILGIFFATLAPFNPFSKKLKSGVFSECCHFGHFSKKSEF